MARCYSGCVRHRYPPEQLPRVWLISDARIDDRLEDVIARFPPGSGFVFRHYHLPLSERLVRYRRLARVARRHGHVVVLSGTARLARRWGADGAYGSPRQLAAGPATLRLVTAHSLSELAAAKRGRADAVLLSPVFPTRTHPGAPHLGPVRFQLLAARSQVPVIALGGMTARRASAMSTARWAAIESLAQSRRSAFSIHS